jgi:hypothetical protein
MRLLLWYLQTFLKAICNNQLWRTKLTMSGSRICLCNYDEVKLLRQKYIPRYYLEYPHVSKLHQMLKNCNTRVLTYFIKKVEPLLK